MFLTRNVYGEIVHLAVQYRNFPNKVFAYLFKIRVIALLSIVFLTKNVYREIVYLAVQNRSFPMKGFALFV